MVVADKASRYAMEAVVVMPTAIPDPPKTGGVEAMRTSKGNPPQNAGIVARKPTRTSSAGRSVPIRRKPNPDLDRPTKEIGSGRTMPKDPKKSKKGQPS